MKYFEIDKKFWMNLTDLLNLDYWATKQVTL